MTQEHSITPPFELTQKWSCDCPLTDPFSREFYVATQAARWGADTELEACCELLDSESPFPKHYCGEWLRNRRRPKPPSLKEQALQALYRFDDTEGHDGLTQEQIAEDFVVIRRALESLPD